MSKRRLILAVLLTAAGVAAYAWFRLGPQPDENVLRVSGNVEVTDVEVSFRMPGWVEARPVSEGETIRAGQLIARLESTELAQEVALREAEVEAYAAELAALEAGSRPQEIAVARAAVHHAQAELERLAAEYRRQSDLFARKVVSEQEFQKAEAEHEVAKSQVEEAQERLKLAEEGPRQEDIVRARARLDQARQSLAIARTRLDYATLSSPISGTVLSENVEAGEYVVPGVPVVTVGDLVDTWLRAYVHETDLGRIKLGQRACVSTDTYAGKLYPGELSFISSAAEFTPKNVQTAEERVKLVYRVKINIHNPDLELKPGMPADADIWLGDGDAPCLR
ncbi:MAG: efflux RND transporter periplasmic adaptor subunit [Thermodesulfobacteriota bacterium]